MCSHWQVIRHIDHVTQASEGNHKCSLLEVELPRIKYSGGGTYTLGAMIEAQVSGRYPGECQVAHTSDDEYGDGTSTSKPSSGEC